MVGHEFLNACKSGGQCKIRPKQQPVSRKYANDSLSWDARICHGKRIEASLTRLYGLAFTEQLLKNIAIQQLGSQPSIADSVRPRKNADDGVQEEIWTGTSVPHAFWPRYISSELGQLDSTRMKMRLRKALRTHAVEKYRSAQTRAGLCPVRSGSSYRSSGGANNSTKAVGLGFMLLQYFVNICQELSCRTDSLMLMQQAREFRAMLLHDVSGKWTESDLPKLIGNAGHQWFRRWRLKYGLTKKVVGMKLKVAWRKVKKRVVVLLTNIFRLRFFWKMCHGNAPMRWLSVDQKPSWFNNAGHTGTFSRQGGTAPTVAENFQHTRERYTVLTSVPSGWPMHDHEDGIPKVALLFKGKANGYIFKRLNAYKGKRPWMKIQTQEEGSYRSKDVVEALDWMLPQAQSSKDSIIVLLDWFSGHLTEDVATKVREKGHVLLFHGGGTTPFTQINDTHLHALLADALLRIENVFAVQQRKLMLAQGNKKTPSKKHEDIIEIVQATWRNINHDQVQEKGYRQTGPTMPLEEPVAPEEIFENLFKVLEAVDPVAAAEQDPIKNLRNNALQYVEEGWKRGWWQTWDDHYKMIQEHDDEDKGDVEGLEAFRADPYGGDYDGDEIEQDDLDNCGGDDLDDDSDDHSAHCKGGDDDDEAPSLNGDDDGDCSDKDEDDASNCTGEGDGSNAGEDEDDERDCAGEDEDDESDCAGKNDDEDYQDADGRHSGGGEDMAPCPDDDPALSPNSSKTASPHEDNILKAQQLLLHDAVQKKNAYLVSFYRKQLRTRFHAIHDKKADVTTVLRKRFVQESEEMRKRAKVIPDEAKLALQEKEEGEDEEAARDEDREGKKRAQSQQHERKRLARVKVLEQSIAKLQLADDEIKHQKQHTTYMRWLQTHFPAKLADSCIKAYRDMRGPNRKRFERQVQTCLDDKHFQTPTWIEDLWQIDKTLTREWAKWKCLIEKKWFSIRCGDPFQQIVAREAAPSTFIKNPPEVILTLLQKTIPHASLVFVGALSPDILLQQNDYCLEKTYVWAILQLSTKLGPEVFPQGVHKWYPRYPDMS